MTPTVHVGDAVSVAGRTQLFHGLIEIGNAAVFDPTPNGTLPTPVALTIAQALDPRYAGTLVTITDPTTIDTAYSCAADDPTCHDTNLWALTGADTTSVVIAGTTMWSGSIASWTAQGAAFQAGHAITGVMSYRFNRRRIDPRSVGDFQ